MFHALGDLGGANSKKDAKKQAAYAEEEAAAALAGAEAAWHSVGEKFTTVLKMLADPATHGAVSDACGAVTTSLGLRGAVLTGWVLQHLGPGGPAEPDGSDAAALRTGATTASLRSMSALHEAKAAMIQLVIHKARLAIPTTTAKRRKAAAKAVPALVGKINSVHLRALARQIASVAAVLPPAPAPPTARPGPLPAMPAPAMGLFQRQEGKQMVTETPRRQQQQQQQQQPSRSEAAQATVDCPLCNVAFPDYYVAQHASACAGPAKAAVQQPATPAQPRGQHGGGGAGRGGPSYEHPSASASSARASLPYPTQHTADDAALSALFAYHSHTGAASTAWTPPPHQHPPPAHPAAAAAAHYAPAAFAAAPQPARAAPAPRGPVYVRGPAPDAAGRRSNGGVATAASMAAAEHAAIFSSISTVHPAGVGPQRGGPSWASLPGDEDGYSTGLEDLHAYYADTGDANDSGADAAAAAAAPLQAGQEHYTALITIDASTNMPAEYTAPRAVNGVGAGATHTATDLEEALLLERKKAKRKKKREAKEAAAAAANAAAALHNDDQHARPYSPAAVLAEGQEATAAAADERALQESKKERKKKKKKAAKEAAAAMAAAEQAAAAAASAATSAGRSSAGTGRAPPGMGIVPAAGASRGGGTGGGWAAGGGGGGGGGVDGGVDGGADGGLVAYGAASHSRAAPVATAATPAVVHGAAATRAPRALLSASAARTSVGGGGGGSATGSSGSLDPSGKRASKKAGKRAAADNAALAATLAAMGGGDSSTTLRYSRNELLALRDSPLSLGPPPDLHFRTVPNARNSNRSDNGAAAAARTPPLPRPHMTSFQALERALAHVAREANDSKMPIPGELAVLAVIAQAMKKGETVDISIGVVSKTGRSKSPPFATEALLENTDGGRSTPSLFSRGGTLLPSMYANARYID